MRTYHKESHAEKVPVNTQRLVDGVCLEETSAIDVESESLFFFIKNLDIFIFPPQLLLEETTLRCQTEGVGLTLLASTPSNKYY